MRKWMIILAIAVVVLVAGILVGRHFLFPMAGHPLVGMWEPINHEQQYIGPMVLSVQYNIYNQPTTSDWLRFEARGRGGIVAAEAPSMHFYRFNWSSQSGRAYGIIVFSDYPRYDRSRIGNFYYSYRIVDENMLYLSPFDENDSGVAIFRRVW